MIEALVFDFDGVIIDTETPDFATWQEEFEAHGVELDRALWSTNLGGGTVRFDVLAHLAELVGRDIDREAIRARRRRHYLDLVESSPLLPGVMDNLVRARELGLRVGVASSSSREWVEGHLASRGLLEYVASIKCHDDVDNVKPDPELFLASVESLGSEPHAAIAIEDSANGVKAAVRAGLWCVVVPNPMTRDLAIDEADLRLNALSDLSLDDVLKLSNDAQRRTR